MPPFLSSITQTFFTSLINRLGVRPPPPDGFDLINTVQPVSLVDADISIPVAPGTIPVDIPFTQGELLAPAANTVLADTGPQPAGTYNALIMVGCDNLANFYNDFRLQRRDAANAANIWSQLLLIGNNGSNFLIFALTFKLQLNERLRLVTKDAGVAGANIQASIWFQ